MKQIFFCRDGALRMRIDVPDRNDGILYSKFIPLQSILGLGVEKSFLSLLSAQVNFEEHLTIGELIENLTPWAGTIGDILDINFIGFVEELRLPPTPLKIYAKSITLEYLVEIEMTFPKEHKHRLNLPKFLGDPLAAKDAGVEFIENWLPRVNLERVGNSNEELIRLIFTPLSEWKHLPITLNQRGSLLDRTNRPVFKTIGDTPLAILNPKHSLVKEKMQRSEGAMNYTAPLSPVPATLYNAVIGGLLREIFAFGSPQIRDEIISDIRLSAEEARRGLKRHPAGAEIYDFSTGGPVASGQKENKNFAHDDFLTPIHDTIELLTLASDELNLEVLDNLNTTQADQ